MNFLANSIFHNTAFLLVVWGTAHVMICEIHGAALAICQWGQWKKWESICKVKYAPYFVFCKNKLTKKQANKEAKITENVK